MTYIILFIFLFLYCRKNFKNASWQWRRLLSELCARMEDKIVAEITSLSLEHHWEKCDSIWLKMTLKKNNILPILKDYTNISSIIVQFEFLPFDYFLKNNGKIIKFLLNSIKKFLSLIILIWKNEETKM